MRSNSGMGYIQMIVIIVVIAFLVGGGVYFVRAKYNENYIETIKTNMLTVQWKVKSYVNEKKAAKEEIQYVGTKTSEMMQEPGIKQLFEKGIIKQEDAEKYYVLKDEDMAKLELEISNEKNSYYVVNYENDDILITKGCAYEKNNVLYRLDDIEKAKK